MSLVTMSATTPYGPLIESRVRLVTWNLWWRLGNWKNRASAIAQTLEDLHPDLVCLQEVWQEGPHNQAAELAERLGMSHAFALDRTEGAVDQGVALLSRCGPLLLMTTHLIPFPHRGEWRERQVRSLVDFMIEAVGGAADLGGRIVVAGGFNAAPEADEIRLLTSRRPPPAPCWVVLDAWETAGDGSPGYTMSKANPNAAPLLLPNLRWDYVFVRWPSGRPGGVGHPVHAEVAGLTARNGVVPSDHYAVVADLRY